MIERAIKNSRIFRLVYETNFVVGPRVINVVGGIHGTAILRVETAENN